jgi:hypothetical protein
MRVNNPIKALILIIVVIAVTVLMLFDKIDPTAGYGLLGTITGYAVGNGIAAEKGENVEPVFGSTRRNRRAQDRLPPPEGH